MANHFYTIEELFISLVENEIAGKYNQKIVQSPIEFDDDSTQNALNISDKLKKDIDNLIEEISKREDSELIEYQKIAKFIYTNEYMEFSSFFERVKDIIGDYLEDTSKRKLIKMVNQAELSYVQRHHLYVSLRDEMQKRNWDLRSEISIEQLNVSKLSNENKDLEKRLKRTTDKLESIYTDFIAILGVFSSFVFVMFGGFDALAKILENLGSTNVSLPRTIFISSLLVMFLFTVLYAQLLWIAKITGRVFVDRSCTCAGRCNHLGHIFGRHRFYLSIMILSFGSVILSMLFLL